MNHTAAPLEVLIDELKRLPGFGDKSATRLAYHSRALRQRSDRPPDSGDPRGPHQAEPVPSVPELHRGGGLSHLRRPQAGPLHHLCGGDAPGCPGHRADPGIPGPVPCAVRPHQPGERNWSRPPDHPGTGEPAGRPRRQGGHHGPAPPTVEGDATSIYLARTLRPIGVRTTRLATGVPVGSKLEQADRQTIFRALEGRREL